MPSDCITFQNSGYFSKLIVDYLNQEEKVKSLYNSFPSIESFKLQLEEKKGNFSIPAKKVGRFLSFFRLMYAFMVSFS